MLKLLALTLILLLPLQGCKTALNVQAVAICPRIPALDQQPAAQVPSFTEPTANFLLGKLTGPSASSLTSPSAKPNMTKPEPP